MNSEQNYIDINRASWNARTEHHLKSKFYDLDGFIKGKSSLNHIELELLGDVRGKSILHLQCYFGQDSLSLARMDADVVGVDFSDEAIKSARELSKTTDTPAEFICCDIFELPQYLDRKFDIVFTSYGVIGWLPDLNKWAQIIHQYLKIDGKFVLVEFHPVVWMFDDDFEKVKYRYFNTGPIIEEESGTYGDRDADITIQNVTWNHGLGEVINSLLSNDLHLVSLEEYDYSPYNCFNHIVEMGPKKFRIQHLEDKIPMVFSLVAQRKMG